MAINRAIRANRQMVIKGRSRDYGTNVTDIVGQYTLTDAEMRERVAIETTRDDGTGVGHVGECTRTLTFTDTAGRVERIPLRVS